MLSTCNPQTQKVQQEEFMVILGHVRPCLSHHRYYHLYHYPCSVAHTGNFCAQDAEEGRHGEFKTILSPGAGLRGWLEGAQLFQSVPWICPFHRSPLKSLLCRQPASRGRSRPLFLACWPQTNASAPVQVSFPQLSQRLLLHLPAPTADLALLSISASASLSYLSWDILWGPSPE